MTCRRTGSACLSASTADVSAVAAKSALRVPGNGHGGAVERAERALHRARDAGEGGGVAQGVGARLGGAQTLHQIEEVGRIVGLESDHELLVVESERVAGVEVHRRVLAPE